MFILASASPRRAELLRQIGVDFRVKTSDFDEASICASSPEEYVKAAAEGKAKAVLASLSGGTVISADTAVIIDNEILGKPKDRDDVVSMLMRLSGKTHRVLTSVCITDGEQTVSFTNSTEVEFIPFPRETAENYAATGECDDKAGAYGIQGMGAMLVRGIRGDYFSVVGLPLCQTAEALKRFGFQAFE